MTTPITPTPSPSPTPKSKSNLEKLLEDFNIGPLPVPSSSDTAKQKKSGVYTRTETAARVPDTLALKDKINKVFQSYYGRDADQTELQTWMPLIQAQYKDKSGNPKTTIKYTYKNGELVNTETLTAEGTDPSLWLDEQIKSNVAKGQLEVNAANIPEGPAGKYFVAIKNLATDNGIRLSDEQAKVYAQNIVAGAVDQNTVYNTIRESAATAFPSLSDKITAGIDLRTLADPYIQSMSNILELPSTSLDVFDPKIRSALAYTLPDGKVGTKSIYDFENDLRKDERWQYTENARKTVSSAALQVLRDFGLQG